MPSNWFIEPFLERTDLSKYSLNYANNKNPFIRKEVTADSVSGWLKKYFGKNQHTAIVGGKIREIRFFGLRTLALL